MANEFFDRAVDSAFDVGVILEKTNGIIHNGIVCHFKTTRGTDVRRFHSYFYIYEYLEGLE